MIRSADTLVPYYCDCKGTRRELIKALPNSTIYSPLCKNQQGEMYAHTETEAQPFKRRGPRGKQPAKVYMFEAPRIRRRRSA